ncbi:MAG: hypothetical protein R3E32_03435 [Chitinophagales bacterium]
MANLKLGDTCPQCKYGKLHHDGYIKKGAGQYELLGCPNCGWKYRNETPS